MSAGSPRIEINLGKIQHNAHSLVRRLAQRGISVTGVTKATLGSPDIARALLSGGVTCLGDSRISNLQRLLRGQVQAPFLLTRLPMRSEVEAVIRHADTSLNSEISTISQLSGAAQRAGKCHGIILMVEMGDLREGILPIDLLAFAQAVEKLPNLELQGIACNLACYGGVKPDPQKMAELSDLADMLEQHMGMQMSVVSGGNSANLEWALSAAHCGRINNLRLGESILLGRETLARQVISGLHTDAFSIVAEVIESKLKPSKPYGDIGQAAFGAPATPTDRGDIFRSILAIGRQDCDSQGLTPPAGIGILGSSSDHLLVESRNAPLVVGHELAFQPNYSALLSAMTSPYVAQVMLETDLRETPALR